MKNLIKLLLVLQTVSGFCTEQVNSEKATILPMPANVEIGDNSIATMPMPVGDEAEVQAINYFQSPASAPTPVANGGGCGGNAMAAGWILLALNQVVSRMAMPDSGNCPEKCAWTAPHKILLKKFCTHASEIYSCNTECFLRLPSFPSGNQMIKVPLDYEIGGHINSDPKGSPIKNAFCDNNAGKSQKDVIEGLLNDIEGQLNKCSNATVCAASLNVLRTQINTFFSKLERQLREIFDRESCSSNNFLNFMRNAELIKSHLSSLQSYLEKMKEKLKDTKDPVHCDCEAFCPAAQGNAGQCANGACQTPGTTKR